MFELTEQQKSPDSLFINAAFMGIFCPIVAAFVAVHWRVFCENPYTWDYAMRHHPDFVSFFGTVTPFQMMLTVAGLVFAVKSQANLRWIAFVFFLFLWIEFDVRSLSVR